MILLNSQKYDKNKNYKYLRYVTISPNSFTYVNPKIKNNLHTKHDADIGTLKYK